ncbi:RNA polymerase sigma factor [Hyphococcus luteus]|nr:sigma-70 family RNA polymerase sigma factor [Marinicaulis flavus]
MSASTKLLAAPPNAPEPPFPALEALYRAHAPGLARQLAARLGCEATALDIVQSAFLKLAEHENPEEIREPERYLFRIALNLASSHASDGARRRRILEENAPILAGASEAAPVQERGAIAREEAALAARVIDRMPRKRRHAAVLFLYHGMSGPKIAEALGIKEAAARKHVSRAMADIREALRAGETRARKPRRRKTGHGRRQD